MLAFTQQRLWVSLWPTRAARRAYTKGAEGAVGHSGGTGDLYHAPEKSLTDHPTLLWSSANRSAPICLYVWVFLHPHCLVATICNTPNRSHRRSLSNTGRQLVLSRHRKRCFKLRTEGRKEGGVVRELGLPPQVLSYIFTSKIRYYMLLLGCKSSFFSASHSYLSHKGIPNNLYELSTDPCQGTLKITSERRR